MIGSTRKHVVCITGSVWTGGRNAPRKLLAKEGFARPTWFTTDHGITDGEYRRITHGAFHQAVAQDEVLVQMDYGSDKIGILRQDFNSAAEGAKIGVLVVGPPEIAAQVAELNPRAVVFVLKTESMELSRHLTAQHLSPRLHRINLDFGHADPWPKAHARMLDLLGLSDPLS